MCRQVVVCLAVAAAALWAEEPKASQLADEARRAERAGKVVQAYLLYAQAAALDPSEPKYWSRSQALRTQALMKKPLRVEVPENAGKLPAVAAQAPGLAAAPPPEVSKAAGSANVGSSITEDELVEVRRLKSPPDLKPTPGKKTLDLRGDAKSLFEQAAKTFGLDTVFDGDYTPGPPLHIHLDDADYRTALRALEAATDSFVFPLGERLIMVVKDSAQKRTENEPTMSVTVPIPFTVAVQEAQEVARAVQQTMDILRLAVDANRRLVLIKDRISKVRPAQALFEELARSRPQVTIEMQFLEVDHVNTLAYGFLMPRQFPMTYFGSGVASTTSTAISLARFFAGHTTIGLGIANAQLFATMNQSYSRVLMESELRASDGTAATLHVGQKYPILTGSVLGDNVQTSGYVPSFNFEDLGLTLKVTPRVHGMDEVSLDIEAEFEVLAGGSLNGIPIISNRKLQSKVRVRTGEWAVVGGLMSSTEARSITGVPGISTLPVVGTVLRQNNRDTQSTDVVVLMRPVLLSMPPDQYAGRVLWVGSEGKLEIPL